MTFPRSIPRFAWVGLCIAITVLGCHDDSATSRPSCVSGAKHDCQGKSGCLGVQECTDDGTWGGCSCEAVIDKGNLPSVGANCSDDAGCPKGGRCLLPDSQDWLGGGPPEGLCVADCSADVKACDNFGNAVCVSSLKLGRSGAISALCMPTCETNSGSVEVPACSGVPSSACEPLEGESSGFCRPFCRFDGDCPSGHCDRQVGVCVSEAQSSAGVSFGASCDVDRTNCEGVCVNLSPDPNAVLSICSNRCTLGTYDECAVAGVIPQASTCAFAVTSSVPGNLGYCTPLCDCNADCPAAGFICRAFSSTGTVETLKSQGMCVPAQAEETGIACIEGS